MSTGLAVEVGADVEPSAIINSSLCLDLAHQARRAARKLAVAGGAAKDAWLSRSAAALIERARGDPRRQRRGRRRRARARAERRGDRPPALDPEAASTRWRGRSARSPRCPTRSARSIASSRRPNGLEVRQVRVPLGVIFMIYESRPNVTLDAAALCVKSGNAAILRGGKEAIHSNRALHRVLADAAGPERPARATPCSSCRRPIARRSASCSGMPEYDRPGHPPRAARA